MITATAWVPRGFAAPFPTKYTFDEEEFKRIADLAKLQLDDAKEDLEEAQNEAEAGDAMQTDGDRSDGEGDTKALKTEEYVHYSWMLLLTNSRYSVTKTMTSRNTTWSTMIRKSKKMLVERVWGCLVISNHWLTTAPMPKIHTLRCKIMKMKMKKEKSFRF